MKNVTELNETEIIEAIINFLHCEGTGDRGLKVKFAFDGQGKLMATVEGKQAEQAEPEDFDDQDEGIGHATVSAARTQRETVDSFSNEPLLVGVQCLWIQDVGVTVVHPVEWPEEVRKEHVLTEVQLEAVSRWLSKKVSVPKISAADLLDQIQERFGDREMAVAICQRDSLDFVSGNALPANTQAVWLEEQGVTITPVEDWPEEWIEVFEGKKPTEASTAADILGGGGGDPVDRSSALEEGLGRKRR